MPSDKLMVKALIQMRVWMMYLGGMRWYGGKIAKGMFPKPEQARLRGELAQQIASNPRPPPESKPGSY